MPGSPIQVRLQCGAHDLAQDSTIGTNAEHIIAERQYEFSIFLNYLAVAQARDMGCDFPDRETIGRLFPPQVYDHSVCGAPHRQDMLHLRIVMCCLV